MSKGHILFVDDDETVLFLLKKLLQQEEYECHFAQSGEEALDKLSRLPIDVLISDMRMPDMDGFQLLSIVKERHPLVVRIILSGYLQVQTILAVINQIGVYRYLTKPFMVNEDTRQVLVDALKEARRLKRETPERQTQA
ncbi:response regulator [Brevibacillus dissolubilis]|uniref:response regulator n=1 Tax=Brevibacillus dissolubilis TaxID=1844116 RepID=UPI0011168358|nr:response regulator [Brevibacillus dissolubilis]